ncbi:MAG: DUF998 domain-containing protein [Terracidiphilus sp.]
MKTERWALQSALLATGFAGLLFIAAFVALGLLAPDYNLVSDTISALEFTPLSLAQRANFFVFGLLLCAFAAGLRRELAGGRGAILIPSFQAAGGIGVIGDAIFVLNPLHLVCDLVAFNSALLVLLLFAWRFRAEPNWRGWTEYSIVTALTMMALLAAFGFANQHGGPAGLMEKLASCTRTIWSVLFSVRLLAGKSLGKGPN